MNCDFAAIFLFFLSLGIVSTRGIHSGDRDRDPGPRIPEDPFGPPGKKVQALDHGSYLPGPGGLDKSAIGSFQPNGKLILEKVKPGPVHEQPVSLEAKSLGVDKRRKLGNGRGYPSGNLTVEYVAGNDNETWNVEKKKKEDLGRDFHGSTCQVTTEELVATAQATVTRALKGLCNANVMEERFEDLESSLNKQLSTVRNMILNLEKRLDGYADTIMYGQKQFLTALTKGCAGVNAIGNGGSHPSNTDVNNKNQKPSYDYPKSNPEMVDDVSDEDVSGTRDPEILKFNSSIHMETSLNGPAKKVFTYYWKIKDMAHKLSGWNQRKSFRSQSFYIFPSGYRMYMRVFPCQNEDNFYVRVGLTKGEFDDTLKWPFPLKHKIHILDQTREGRLFEDIASRVWDPNLLCSDFNWQKPIKGDNHECIEIAFPHDVLRQREYIRKDTLVIKLTVYLES